MKHTQEEKKDYFKNLRAQWKANKEASEGDQKAKETYEAIRQEAGGSISYMSFYMVYSSMRALGLEGVPYVDTKTYNKWQEAGFVVKKGEKCKIKGISWIECKTKGQDSEDGYMLPKEYSLFHASQVEAI